MKEEKCRECHEVIPAGACQQGQSFKGEWFPFHVGCVESFCDRKINVWEVTFDGTSYLEDDVSAISDMIQDMDEDGVYQITKKRMKQGDFLRLPEFTGF